jgi:hypothetical protein
MRPSFLDDMSWRMAEVYGAVTDRILVNLARHFPLVHSTGQMRGSFEYQVRMLAQLGQVRQETVRLILDSLSGADEALRASLEAAIRDALKTEEPKLRKAAEKGLLPGAPASVPEVEPGQMQAFRSYYRQSADKLNLVNTVMLESTEQAYRSTVADVAARIERSQGILNEATGEVVTGVSTWNTAMRDAVQKMVANGLTGFIDHGGHHWSPEAYVAMDVRTTMFNTARAAIWERSEQFGSDLYQVSSHNAARPLCYPWQGKVISRNDIAQIVEDIDGNQVEVIPQSATSYGEAAGLFGVNCKHYPMTFIPGFSALRGEPQGQEENAKAYAQSQEQRRLERRLREEKRDLAVMRAQGADPDQIRTQRERIRKASDDIDAFCDQTGLPRRKNREYTPVNATWPDTDATLPRTGGNGPNSPDAPPVQMRMELENAGTRPMTQAEASAIESYVSGDTMYINQVLRGRAGDMTDEDRALIRDMDSALDVPIGKAQTLYRSVDAEAVFGRVSVIDYENLRASVLYSDTSAHVQQTADRLIGKVQGRTITEPGYMSTTKDAEIAYEWGGFTGSEKPIVLRLNTPASTRGRDLEQFEIEDDEQKEVLLARGQKYRVRSVTGAEGSIVVNADILEQ